MSSPCPHFNVTYATWRLQILRQLYVAPGSGTAFGLPFLYPTGTRRHNSFRTVKRALHNTASRGRNNLKDVKRSAKYQVAHLPLRDNDLRQRDNAEQTGFSDPTSFSEDKTYKQRAPDWNPYDDSSIEEMQNLVGDLKTMAKEAAQREPDNEEIPFERSFSLKRKRFFTPESPLERRLPWDREKKLQAGETNIDKRLADNVWAQMLSSPVRMDRSTKARLPRDLMIDWGMVRNPDNKQDYLLPLELSNLDALKEELKSTRGVADSQSRRQPEQEDQELPSHDQNLGHAHRIPIAPSRLALKAMTDEFIIHPPVRHGELSYAATSSARISATLVPFRWRSKQTQMRTFQKTRQRFYDALGRKPDVDEPDMESMARLHALQWQPGMAERVEKILRDRVLIALEALSRDNQTVRAVHHRRITAIPIPHNGQLYLDAEGRISGIEPVGQSCEADGETGHERESVPEWIHGAILLHVGGSESLHTLVREWSEKNRSSIDHTVTASHLIPPMIGINNRFHLPIFDLETMLGHGNTHRVRQLIDENDLLRIEFWNQFNNKRTKPKGSDDRSENFGPSTMRFEHSNSTAETPTDTNEQIQSPVLSPSDETANFRPFVMQSDQPGPIADSPTDAGEQVLSSIMSPGAAAAPPVPNADRETQEMPTSSRSQKILSSGSDCGSDNQESAPYLILVKATAKHAGALTREIWQLWRFNGGTTPW